MMSRCMRTLFMLSFVLIAGGVDAAEPVTLDELLASVERHYPMILSATYEREVAEGELQRAQGAFDVKLGIDAKSTTAGFYENDRLDLALTQPLRPLGIDLVAGYRQGDGDFADYDKGLATNGDGELRLGVRMPLLRDRAIDPRRAKLRAAELGLLRAAPILEESRLQAGRAAILAYWEWLAAGEKDRIAQSLVINAETRREALLSAVEEGLIAEITLVDNERLLAERRGKQIATERRLQEAAIDLSLYLRDSEGAPLVPDPSQLPPSFPELTAPTVDLQSDLELAWNSRPELARMRLDREKKQVELARSRNALLPEVDLAFDLSRDQGTPFSSPDDKGDTVVKAGLAFELPLQRRKARGEVRARGGELSQFDQKIRFVRDRIGVKVRDAHSEWVQAYRRFEQARRSLELARELEEAERLQLSEGNSDLLRLNIREQQTAQAASFLIDVKTDYFEAKNDYQAAIGVLRRS